MKSRRREAQQIIEGVAKRLRCNDDTTVKQQIIEAYCDDRIPQDVAMRMIQDLDLVNA